MFQRKSEKLGFSFCQLSGVERKESLVLFAVCYLSECVSVWISFGFLFLLSFTRLITSFTCHFSTVWLFYHFQVQLMQWYFLWDGMPYIEPHLCGLASVVQPPYFANSKCTPCYLRCPTRSTKRNKRNPMSTNWCQNQKSYKKLNLFARTLPPVTEKLAKMQYFSFLWPV